MWLKRLRSTLTGLPWWLHSKESTRQCLNASDTGSVLGREEPLKEEMATHSSVLAWRIPWIQEHGRIAKSQTWLNNNNMLTQCFAVRTRKLVSMVYWLRRVCVCVCVSACVHACSPSLMSDSLQCPPASSVHGISQARIVEWVVISSSRGSFQTRDQTWVPCVFCTGRQVLYL